MAGAVELAVGTGAVAEGGRTPGALGLESPSRPYSFSSWRSASRRIASGVREEVGASSRNCRYPAIARSIPSATVTSARSGSTARRPARVWRSGFPLQASATSGAKTSDRRLNLVEDELDLDIVGRLFIVPGPSRHGRSCPRTRSAPDSDRPRAARGGLRGLPWRPLRGARPGGSSAPRFQRARAGCARAAR